jgi:hypothetical protein
MGHLPKNFWLEKTLPLDEKKRVEVLNNILGAEFLKE